MPNWSDWRDHIKVVYTYADPSLSQSDRKVLEDIFVPLASSLAEQAPRSQFFHDLARCYTEHRCSELTYDPKSGSFVYTKDGKERHVNADLFQEKGFRVCQKPSGDVYIRFGKTVPGTLAVDMSSAKCDPSDESLGTIHLHPAGAVFPSGEDMLVSIRDRYNCIAGRVYDPKSKKDFARVLCYVTDDVYRWPSDVPFDSARASAEYPDLLQMYSKYRREITKAISSYGAYEIVVKDERGNVYDYIFPPSAIGVLDDLVRKVKEYFKDSHSFELEVVDLSESEPPDLYSLER